MNTILHPSRAYIYSMSFYVYIESVLRTFGFASRNSLCHIPTLTPRRSVPEASLSFRFGCLHVSKMFVGNSRVLASHHHLVVVNALLLSGKILSRRPVSQQGPVIVDEHELVVVGRSPHQLESDS